MTDSFDRLFASILAARGRDPALSRTAKLFRDGMPKMAKKLAEEAVEVGLDAVMANRLFARIPHIHHEDGFNQDETVRQKPKRVMDMSRGRAFLKFVERSKSVLSHEAREIALRDNLGRWSPNDLTGGFKAVHCRLELEDFLR